MLRKSTVKNYSLAEPLDNDEQEKVLKEIATQASINTLNTRKMFCYVFLLVAIIFLFLFVFSSIYEWNIDHQRVFKNIIPIMTFKIFYFLSFVNFLVFSHITKNSVEKIDKRLIYFGWLISIVLLSMWLAIFFIKSVTNPFLYWMPFSNVVGILLISYIEKDTNSLMSEVKKLEKFKYEFRSI